MRYYHDIIVKPVMTEKSMNLQAENKYTFIVDKLANKTKIKNTVEKVNGAPVQRKNRDGGMCPKRLFIINHPRKSGAKNEMMGFPDGGPRCKNGRRRKGRPLEEPPGLSYL